MIKIKRELRIDSSASSIPSKDGKVILKSIPVVKNWVKSGKNSTKSVLFICCKTKTRNPNRP